VLLLLEYYLLFLKSKKITLSRLSTNITTVKPERTNAEMYSFDSDSLAEKCEVIFEMHSSTPCILGMINTVKYTWNTTLSIASSI